MWRKRLSAFMILTAFTLLVAGASFVAGVRAAEYPATSIASRVPFVSRQIGAVTTHPGSGAPEDVKDDFAVFWDVWHIIRDDYFGESDQQAMIQGAIQGMVDALNDPYTRYVDPQANAIMREDDSGEIEGIGAKVDMIDGQLTIVAPLEGSPADEAGLKAGDVILQVNEIPIQDMDLLEAVSLVRGPKGTSVRLTVRRDDRPEPFTVSIVRAEIPLVTVDGHMLGNHVGYLAIHNFDSRTAGELDTNLSALAEQGAQALVLDLRNNPGGFLDVAVETVSRFLDDGPALWWQQADGTVSDIAVKERQTYDWPMVVLVNKGSASASEIVAGALQDDGRVILIGTTTFGKGSVQNVHQLRNGGSVRVTTAHWLTRGKHEIDGVGLQPDYQITQDEDHPAFDRQLDVARRMLEKRFTLPGHIPYR